MHCIYENDRWKTLRMRLLRICQWPGLNRTEKSKVPVVSFKVGQFTSSGERIFNCPQETFNVHTLGRLNRNVFIISPIFMQFTFTPLVFCFFALDERSGLRCIVEGRLALPVLQSKD